MCYFFTMVHFSKETFNMAAVIILVMRILAFNNNENVLLWYTHNNERVYGQKMFYSS